VSLAVVLAGGGARGAYEVGVLSYVFEVLGARRGPARVDFVCGTSVGAIHAAFLASVLDQPVEGMAGLRALWSGLELPQIVRLGPNQARSFRRALRGGASGGGLLDPGPLAKLVSSAIRWRRLASNLRRGRLRALSVTATHAPTGSSYCFVDAEGACSTAARSQPSEHRDAAVGGAAPSQSAIGRAPHPELEVRNAPARLPTLGRRRIAFKCGPIRAPQVLASSAIPILFPPVLVDGDLFFDGGLRLDTPLSPALTLGAERVLVVSTSSIEEGAHQLERGRYPGISFLLGKVLDAFFLDHLRADLDELSRINDFLSAGRSIFGSDFVDRMGAAAVERGTSPRRVVRPLVIRPSQSLGRIASESLRKARSRVRADLGRTLLRWIQVGEGAETSDLVSYLLFDAVFAEQLIALGRRDAEARRSELESFLYDS
jgi:NTE family protein